MPYKLTWWREARHTHWRHAHWRHSTHRSSREASSQILLKQRVRLSFCVVGVCNTVDDLLCLVAGYLLVVGLDVAEMVATVIVRLAHAHTVMRKVDIAVVAEELGHRGVLVRNDGRLVVGAVMGWFGVARQVLDARRDSSRILEVGHAGCRRLGIANSQLESTFTCNPTYASTSNHHHMTAIICHDSGLGPLVLLFLLLFS